MKKVLLLFIILAFITGNSFANTDTIIAKQTDVESIDAII